MCLYDDHKDIILIFFLDHDNISWNGLGQMLVMGTR